MSGSQAVQKLFESLHSALIDELNERFPDIKPELGLPRPHSDWTNPMESEGEFLTVDVTLDGGLRAVLFLLVSDGAEPLAEELWDAILGRGAAEFERRGIEPRFGKIHRLKRFAPDAEPPVSVEDVTRLIWVPIAMEPPMHVFYGLGLRRPSPVH